MGKKVYFLADLKRNPFTKTTSRGYGIALGSDAPSGNVTVSFTSANGYFTTSASITFTSSNYRTPQVVTLTGVDNALVEGYRDDTFTITCTGGGYDGVFRNVFLRIYDSGLDYQFASGYAWLTGVNIAALANVATKRTRLISGDGSTYRGVFNTAGLPSGAVPNSIDTNLAGATVIGQTQVSSLVGAAGVDRLTWTMLDGSGATWTNLVYHIRATSSNNKCVMVCGGHSSEIEHINCLNDLLAQGFNILYAFMPSTFQNTETNAAVTGTGVSAHNSLSTGAVDTSAFMALELFYFDKIKSVNYAVANYTYTHYYVVGCSGGGLMALDLAAMDTRFTKCVEIRGVKPVPFRAFTDESTAANWDYEQGPVAPYYTRNTTNCGVRVDALYQDVSLYDRMILASINNDGTPRRLHMTHHAADSCCHGKFTYALWKDYLKSHITSLGGSFDLTLSTDATYVTHGFRANDRSIMINEFTS